EVAQKYAAVVATGRSDFPNQINNVLAFPGIFRGALDAKARRITPAMKIAAANAIAELAAEDLSADYIVPSPLDPRVAPAQPAGRPRRAGRHRGSCCSRHRVAVTNARPTTATPPVLGSVAVVL